MSGSPHSSRRRLGLVFGAVCLILSCTRVVEGKRAPRPRLWFAPPDLTTYTQGPLRVLVDNNASPVGHDRLDALAAILHLVTWPDRRSLEVEVEVTDFVPRRENGYEVFGQATLELRPKVALDDGRWHAMVLERIPEGLEISPSVRLPGPTAKEVFARFKRASDPQLTHVRRCKDPGGSGGKVLLDFSEPIVVSDLSRIVVRAPEACAPNLIDNAAITSIGFTCHSLDRARPVEVMTGALMSASGGSMSAGVIKSIAPEAFTPWESCEIWSVEN